MKIAFFDSGIGGLTVLKAAFKKLPDYEYIYYADTKHAPYGTKTKAQIRKYIFEAVDFLAKKKIGALVIACNTATSAAVEDLRRKYDFPIIGMEPAVKPAFKAGGKKKILVLATSFTLRGKKFKSLLKKFDKKNQVIKLPLDPLVVFAENLDFDSAEVKKYLEKTLRPLRPSDVGSVVLGCTHFVFYRNLIKKFFPRSVKIFDGNEGTVNHLKKILPARERSDFKCYNRIAYYF